jgi:hypothetical protein
MMTQPTGNINEAVMLQKLTGKIKMFSVIL